MKIIKEDFEPINDYGVVGNLETVALISKTGSVDWLCLPDFDSPSVFAGILDKEKGGFFQIKPAEKFFSQQRYIENTNILETTFYTETGNVVKITDFMPPKVDHICKKCSLIRKLEVIKGTLPIQFIYKPKFDYARIEPTYSIAAEGMITAKDGDNTLVLETEINFHHIDNCITEEFVANEGHIHWFNLYYMHEKQRLINAVDVSPVNDASDLLEMTREFWLDWSSKFAYDKPFKDEVLRSLLILKLLIYNPTGALINSPTTSLPEHISGSRNWDYRYVWLKDIAFAYNALLHTGYKDEAYKLFSWLQDICMQRGRDLTPVVGLRGEVDLIEHNLDYLSGYMHSSPVRIGNNAYSKFELDSFGMVLRCALAAIESRFVPKDQMIDILIDYTNILSEIWHNPDYGIWETRDIERQFIFSKAAAYIGLDAGIKIAKIARPDNPNIERWEKTKQDIHNKINEMGWSPEKDRFVMHNHTHSPDASLLLLGILGYLPITDHRIKSTIFRTKEELSTDSLVYRYKTDEYNDGIGEPEGAYTSCSFWLAHCYALMGDDIVTKYMLENLLDYANPLMLFPEEINPSNKKNLGNYPYSPAHTSFINAALSLKPSLY